MPERDSPPGAGATRSLPIACADAGYAKDRALWTPMTAVDDLPPLAIIRINANRGLDQCRVLSAGTIMSFQ
jgi:hypothetical protein